jgi:hypothetical protein
VVEPKKRHSLTLPSGLRVPYVAPLSRRQWLSGISAAFAYAAIGDLIPLARMSQVCAAQPYQGFGAGVTGGAGSSTFHVTTLSGSVGTAGSLPNIMFQGGAGPRSNAIIVFDISGVISPGADADIHAMNNVTIDGLTAPGAGVTVDLTNRTRFFNFEDNCHNIILRGFRIRRTSFTSGGSGLNDCISWTGDVTPSTGLILDQMSLYDAADGCLDVTRLSRDVTVQWSIIRRRRANTSGFTQAFEAGASLIGWSGYNVTFHHSMLSSWERNPTCDKLDDGHGTAPSAATSADVRCCLIGPWADPANSGRGIGYGSQAYGNAKMNCVKNYYTSETHASNAIVLNASGSGGQAYTNGNVSQQGANINGVGNVGTPFTAPSITEHDALTSAAYCLSCAGCRVGGLDSEDQAFINGFTIPGLPNVSCGGGAPNVPIAPLNLTLT